MSLLAAKELLGSGAAAYRFGFNGKEADSSGEWGENNTHYDYGFRIYNPAIAKFLSVDPLAPDYPWYTPYQFAGNMPIYAIDLDGLEPEPSILVTQGARGRAIQVIVKEDDLGFLLPKLTESNIFLPQYNENEGTYSGVYILNTPQAGTRLWSIETQFYINGRNRGEEVATSVKHNMLLTRNALPPSNLIATTPLTPLPTTPPVANLPNIILPPPPSSSTTSDSCRAT